MKEFLCFYVVPAVLCFIMMCWLNRSNSGKPSPIFTVSLLPVVNIATVGVFVLLAPLVLVNWLVLSETNMRSKRKWLQ